MFTGLIESLGYVTALRQSDAGWRLVVRCDFAHELTGGESIAVNGVCLTVARQEPMIVEFDVAPETARVTSLADLTPGRAVNLERPLRADGRIGGHFVQGHVDGTATLESVEAEGEFYRLAFIIPAPLATYVIPRGSIAIDGISLTIAALGDCRIEVQIVPHTWTHTNLASLSPGARVNLECDVLGKYVMGMLDATGLARVMTPDAAADAPSRPPVSRRGGIA